MTLMPKWLDDARGRLRRGRGVKPYEGLTTLADADTFIAEIRSESPRVVTIPAPRRHVWTEPVGIAPPVRTPARILYADPVPPLAPHFDGSPAGGRHGLEMTRSEPVANLGATPILDELLADRARRERMMRTPTGEMRIKFDLIAERWLCMHCECGDCSACPGCPCPCRMPFPVVRGV